MCGLCGEVAFRGNASVDRERTQAMTRLLAHRGPDGEGFWDEPGVSLGHRRLSIIDLSEAAGQPMTSPDGRFVLVYNGEIYNFQEIRRELLEMGEEFQTRSDTEVLLRALMVWGRAAVARLNGMWAFALWDRKRRRLLLSRDRLGIKPLYWARIRGGIVFSSEIPPLLLHPQVSRSVDTKALCEQVACRYVLAPRTLFSSIQKLPPGHNLIMEGNRIQLDPYWTVPTHRRILHVTEEEALGRFSDAFEKSVTQRLVSDVPLGVLLSGGVDSSAVVAAMRQGGQDRIATFTVAFEGGGKYDERNWSREVVETFHTEHHEVVIGPEDFLGGLGKVLHHLDEPVADLAVLPLYFVCRLAGESVKVLLSGQGADEILGGYHLDRVLRQIASIGALRHVPLARRIAAFIARGDFKRAYLADWESIRGASRGQLPGRMRYDLTMPLPPSRMESLLKDPIPPPYDRTLDALYSGVPSHRGPLDSILSVLCRGWLPDNLLSHSDRMSMAHGLEMRVPFLDHDLVTLCFRLPEEFKVRSGETKYLLKEYAIRRGIPLRIAKRRKRGFPVPWGRWIRDPLYGPVREILGDADWMAEYFDREAILELLDEHRKGADHSLLLWNLTVLAHWGKMVH